MHLPSGRRTVLTLLATAFAVLGLAANAFAAGSVSIDNTSTGYGADSTAAAGVPANNFPQNRTEQRSASIDFTVAGSAVSDTNSCSLDGGLANPCPGTGDGSYTYSNAGPLSLGVHKLVVTNTGGGQATYVWRIEPPQYYYLVRSSSPIGFWELDDAGSASIAADSSPAGLYPGDYKNFVIKRNPALTTCENQPHPPFACDWYVHSDNVNYTDPTTVDPNTSIPSNPGGRDAKGYSAYFSGRDDHIQIEGMPNTASSWSIEAWVKPGFSQESRGIFQHVPSLWAEPSDANNMRFACSGLNDEGNAVFSQDIPNATFDGTKFHVICTFSGGQYGIHVHSSTTDYSSLAPVSTTWTSPTTGAYQGFIGLVNKTSGLWWKGYIDNVAYYGAALSDSTIKWHYETGFDVDSNYDAAFLSNANGEDVTPPSASDISSPPNNAQYSPDAQNFKQPIAQFNCADVGANASGIQLCTATLDGNPINSGDPLALTSGTHTVTLTATDNNNNVWTHTHTYYVSAAGSGYSDLIKCIAVPSSACDSPLAYYRLDELTGATTIVDSGPNAYNGDYKNDQDKSGNTGVSGDSDGTRAFFGKGGYAAINNISAPQWGYTMELWWKPADTGSMMLMQHGSNGAIWTDGTNINFRPDERGGTASLPIASLPGGAIVPNDWYFVAATYDGITGTVYAERSDQSITSLPLSASVSSHYQDGAGSADTLYLGYGDQLGGTGWLRGELDEVAYWGTSLSAAKLTQHFNADPPAGDVTYGKSISKPSKLAAAKAKVKAATKALAKAKAKVKYLKRHHARARLIHKAQVNVKAKAKALAKAKARVRALSRH